MYRSKARNPKFDDSELSNEYRVNEVDRGHVIKCGAFKFTARLFRNWSALQLCGVRS
ncbi:unnamed protein product [Heligmosomoides polygyrus]|uniref:C2 domain-containing protein n=1 Tax=Heligmosomoides polygyrus TaxID=6339 RepID=A0A183FH10_HELPZ|nr:unnamed protein product [Heligmosomoides polygyrus]